MRNQFILRLNGFAHIKLIAKMRKYDTTVIHEELQSVTSFRIVYQKSIISVSKYQH